MSEPAPTYKAHSNRSDSLLPPLDLAVETRANGDIHLHYNAPLKDFDPRIIPSFLDQAAQRGDKTLYARRQRREDGGPGAWQSVTFNEAAEQVQAIGQWFIDDGAQPGDVLLIITGNSVAHALMRLGAMAAGLVCCPVSANYALTGNFSRLNYVAELVKPRYVFAENAGALQAALSELTASDASLISDSAAQWPGKQASLQTLLEQRPAEEIRDRINASDPDAPAVYMLTSGSTGKPKAVIQTQRMLTTNLHQAFQMLGKLSGWDDIMLDWLPWSHVSGSFNLYAAAVFGGSLYVDDGKPVPGLFEETLFNLKEIALPYFCNVPLGYAALVDALEADEALCHTFFSRLKLMLYGGAGLSQPIMDRLQALAVRETGHTIMMTTGYGATETASGCMAIYFPTDKVGIGLPMPGLYTKLVPLGKGRFEVRLKGDNIMPGYLDNPEATAAAFDDDGYYRTGDTAAFHDTDDPGQGLYFAGRLAEEFKLNSGTWVRAGDVRTRVIAALAPAISDLLLCGQQRDELAVLGIPNPTGLDKIAGEKLDDPAALQQHPRVRAFLAEALAAYNQNNPGSSTAIRRFAFMQQLPDPARNELSDKGTVNQVTTAANRGPEIEALYAAEPAAHVVLPVANTP